MAPKRREKNLTDAERKEVIWCLSENKKSENKNGLAKGAIIEVAKKFKCSPLTVRRIWQRGQASTGCVDSRLKGRNGRKAKDRSENLKAMRQVPARQRSTIRSLANAISVPKSSLHVMLKKKQIKRVSSTVKPLLSEENLKQRLQYGLDILRCSTRTVIDPYNRIHVDEKWFYITKIKNNYYLLPDEEPPERPVKSKRFITKVMFLAAVAMPRFDDNQNCTFSGLLGIWPFVKTEPAKRNSKNRPKGTLVTKCLEVTKTEYADAIKNKLIPAIYQRWPLGEKNVEIQQDNATPHGINIEAICQSACKDGWTFKLKNQPPNSPDFNVLDLGFFNSIQSLQQKKCMNNVDELVKAVKDAFWELSPETLESTWITWQTVIEASMLVSGSNKYKIPHLKKDSLRKADKLVREIVFSEESIDIAMDALDAIVPI